MRYTCCACLKLFQAAPPASYCIHDQVPGPGLPTAWDQYHIIIVGTRIPHPPRKKQNPCSLLICRVNY